MRQATSLTCPTCDNEIPLAAFDRQAQGRPGVLFTQCGGCGVVVEVAWNGQTWDPDLSVARAARPAVVRQAVPGLDLLLAALHRDRVAMRHALGTLPADPRRQSEARRQLAVSLEAYAAALTARNLPIPPSLRDELSLQSRLAGHRASGH